MNQIFLILSVLFSAQCFGQKWHLNNVDRSEEFPYEYWFQFENIDDTTSHQLIKKTGDQTSTISVYDNQGDTLIFANIRIKNIENDDFVTNISSDFNGQTSIKLEKGTYKIQVSHMNFQQFELQFEIQKEQYIELKINLGLSPELTVYQINSKTKLNENKILEIMDCVKQSRKKLNKNCSDKDKYLIMMQI